MGKRIIIDIDIDNEETDVQVMKDYILKYITKSFNENNFERANSLTDQTFFDISYEEFLKHNKQCIDFINNFYIKTIYNMCLLFDNDKVLISDDEYYDNTHVVSIYFNQDGQLVILGSY